MRPMIRRLLAVPALLFAAVALSACSSGGSSSPSSSSTPTSSSSGSVPAVANATDLKVAPVISPGTGTPPTHLITKDLVVGTGAEAKATSTVEVQYVGTIYGTGTVFDSSWKRGQPATFPLDQVIPGFTQAITGMKVGGRRIVVIPPALGYGAQGSPPAIGPNAT